MSWDLDRSEPLISPERVLEYYGQLTGNSESLPLPDLIVGTFQRQAMDRMVARIGADDPIRWPTPIFWPLARGSFQGRDLAVVRLPVGASAAASALELMVAAGARTVLLVGSAGSLQPHIPVGSLVVATEALRYEGTSHHYLPKDQPARASTELVDALASAALRVGRAEPIVGTFWTTDAPYRECSATVAHLRSSGVLAVEMEAAALFAVATHRRVRIALLAAISDQLGSNWAPGFHTLSYRRGLLTAADTALAAAATL